MKLFLLIYGGVILGMSLIAFITYGIDKLKAQNGSWRIRESVLLGLGFFGGAIGALLGMEIFRHKTRHWYFWVVNILSLAIHIAIAVLVCVYLF